MNTLARILARLFPEPDTEAAAISLCSLAVHGLPVASRERVLRYVWGRFVDEPKAEQAVLQSLAQVQRVAN